MNEEQYDQMHSKFVILNYIYNNPLFPWNGANKSLRKTIRSLIRNNFIRRLRISKKNIIYTLTDRGKNFMTNLIENLG
jgi:DNA-binding PadR family transcriptional regulator